MIADMARQKARPTFNPNACNECEFVAKTRTGLSSHMRGTHGHNKLPEEASAAVAAVPTVKQLRQSWKDRKPAPIDVDEYTSDVSVSDARPVNGHQDAFAIADTHIESARQVLRARKGELEAMLAERATLEEELQRIDGRLAELELGE